MTRSLLLPLIPLAYLAGSIPFGLLVGLAKGIDVRKTGSGNIGATNVGRLLGARYFAIVFTLDLLKGMLPMLGAYVLLRGINCSALDYLLWLAIGFAAILGHMFSLFLKFKGGKGVATSAGVAFGLFPFYTFAALAALIIWAILFALWRYVSLASIFAALAFPIAYALIGSARGWDLTGRQLPLLLFAILIALMVVIKHRSNISRLRSGTEHRAGDSGT